MLDRRDRPKCRITNGEDKGYDVNDFIRDCRERKATLHLAQRKDERDSLLDKRTTRHDGYRISLEKRKRIEEVFGWWKSSGCIQQVKVRGVNLVKEVFDLSMSVYNILRMSNIATAPT